MMTVQRRIEAGEWMNLASPKPMNNGFFTYDDQGLDAGRYGYRLALGSEQYSAETWVTVPGGYALSLAGFTPNPATSASRIAFSLHTDGPATLEVFSVRGQRVMQQEVGSFGAGDHFLALPRSPGLSPGVYWIRLTQSGKSVVVKGVLTQ